MLFCAVLWEKTASFAGNEALTGLMFVTLSLKKTVNSLHYWLRGFCNLSAVANRVCVLFMFLLMAEEWKKDCLVFFISGSICICHSESTGWFFSVCFLRIFTSFVLHGDFGLSEMVFVFTGTTMLILIILVFQSVNRLWFWPRYWGHGITSVIIWVHFSERETDQIK